MITGHVDQLRAALADRYSLERELGQGGMATVYLAHDVKHGREVAVKVLRPDLAATLGPERFLREIRIAAQLHHPHILGLHDSGEASGFLYYVMPYVTGDSLRQRLSHSGELPIGDAVRILRDVADALAYAHEQGVVHRDIKPENVLLSGRHALVADFGVAKAVSEAGTAGAGGGRQGFTTAGVALGTPAYMAPEQAAADPHVDHRADIYALGIMGYELLAGQPPFSGGSPQSVLAAHVTQTPAPLEIRRPSCPPALTAMIMRCLEKKPADRWQSAGELVAQLEAVLTPSGGTTPTDSRLQAAARESPSGIRRSQVAAALAVAVLLASAWWRFGAARHGSRPDRIAVLPIENTTHDTSRDYLADGLTRELISSLTAANVRVIGYRSVAHYRGSEATLRQVASDLQVDAIAVGSILRAGDRLQVALELTDPQTGENLWAETYTVGPEELAGLSNRAARTVAARLGATIGADREARLREAPRVDPEAYAAYLRGKAEAERYTLESFRHSIAHFERAVEIDSTFAPAWAGLGYALEIGISYAFIPAADGHARAASAIDRALVLDAGSGLAHLARAELLLLRDLDFTGADQAYRTAIDLAPTSEAYQMYGWFLDEHRGRYADAVRMLEKAVELDPSSALMHGDLAWRLLAAGQVDRARQEVRVAMAVDSSYPESEWILAMIHSQMGQYDSAMAELTRYAARSGRQVLGLRGAVLAHLGRVEEARALLHTLERQSGREGPWGGAHRAELLLALGEPDSALAVLKTSADRREWWYGFNYRWAPLRTDPRYQALLRQIGAVR
jgi:serine/threonine-protein kinase